MEPSLLGPAQLLEEAGQIAVALPEAVGVLLELLLLVLCQLSLVKFAQVLTRKDRKRWPFLVAREILRIGRDVALVLHRVGEGEGAGIQRGVAVEETLVSRHEQPLTLLLAASALTLLLGGAISHLYIIIIM